MQSTALKTMCALIICCFLSACMLNTQQNLSDKRKSESEEILQKQQRKEIPPLKQSVLYDASTNEGNQLWLRDLRDSLDDLTRKLSNKPVIKIYNVTRTGPDGGELKVPVVKVRFSGMVFFDSGSSRLRRESVLVLSKFADKVLNDYPDTRILLLGHTDSDGSFESNKELSKQRAINVMEELRKRGVMPEMMSTLAIGEMRPIESNKTEKGKAKNRRVEFLLSSNEEANREVVVEDKEFCEACIDDDKPRKERELTVKKVEQEVASLEAVKLPQAAAEPTEKPGLMIDSKAIVAEQNEKPLRRVIESPLTGIKVIQDR